MEEEIKFENSMQAQDSVSASLAQCYITIGDQQYDFMQMINFEAKIEKIKSEIPILGKTGKGNKSTGWKGTGTATLHYNQSVLRNLLEDYKDGIGDKYFTVQVTNYDKGSSAGAQTITLKECNINGGILAKFDASGEYLDEEVEFTFEDFSIDKEFALLTGMKPNVKTT